MITELDCLVRKLSFSVSLIKQVTICFPVYCASSLGLLRWHGLKTIWQASSKVEGNFKGDGTLLGGSFVVGPGDQGILFQHQSREFGDRASLEDIMKAVEKINNA